MVLSFSILSQCFKVNLKRLLLPPNPIPSFFYTSKYYQKVWTAGKPQQAPVIFALKKAEVSAQTLIFVKLTILVSYLKQVYIFEMSLAVYLSCWRQNVFRNVINAFTFCLTYTEGLGFVRFETDA